MSNQQPESKLRHWLPLAILTLGLFIVVIDSTILNVSLGPIIRDLHTTITNMQWVISAYSLTLAALLITGGRLGDLFGRKRMFVIGAIIFAFGSLITSLSNSFSTMIIGESIIEGLGAALMTPATSSLLVTIYKGRDRSIAYGLWGSIAAIGLAIGPILGGYFATNYSWRWGFRINLFIVLILIFGSRLLPSEQDYKQGKKVDWLGVTLSSIGLLAIMFAIIESPVYGLIHQIQPLIIGGRTLSLGNLSVIPWFIIVGIVTLIIFMAYQKQREKRGLPLLVSPHLFTIKQYTAGTFSYGIFALAQVSLSFTLAVFFQTVRGFNSLQTSYIYLPLALSLLVAAPLAGYIGTRVSSRYLVQIGFLLQIVESIYIFKIMSVSTTVWDLVPALIIAGVGLGILSSQIANLTLSAVPITEAGEASGIMQTLRQVGGALGTALTGAVIVAIASTHMQNKIIGSTDVPINQKDAIVELVKNQSSSLEFGGLKLPDSNYSPYLKEYADESIVDGNRDAFLLIATFSLVGLITTFWLSKHKSVS